MIIEDDHIALEAATGDQAHASEAIEAQVEVTGEEKSIEAAGFNPHYLLDASGLSMLPTRTSPSPLLASRASSRAWRRSTVISCSIIVTSLCSCACPADIAGINNLKIFFSAWHIWLEPMADTPPVALGFVIA